MTKHKLSRSDRAMLRDIFIELSRRKNKRIGNLGFEGIELHSLYRLEDAGELKVLNEIHHVQGGKIYPYTVKIQLTP
jgi:hypothetical protein